jgi:Spy/CpxP family protein refolding chaperone
MGNAVRAILVLLAVAPSNVGAQTLAWWQRPDMQLRLRLTRHQVAALDEEFTRTLSERQRLRQELDAADRQVAAALEDGTLPDAVMIALITRAEQLRARRNVARATLVFRLYRVLTPDQRAALHGIEPMTSPPPARRGGTVR